jgi:hypothetical protein
MAPNNPCVTLLARTRQFGIFLPDGRGGVPDARVELNVLAAD